MSASFALGGVNVVVAGVPIISEVFSVFFGFLRVFFCQFVFRGGGIRGRFLLCVWWFLVAICVLVWAACYSRRVIRDCRSVGGLSAVYRWRINGFMWL